MAKFNLDNYTTADGLGFPLNFRRGNPNPLDNSSVWASLDDAKNYAKNDPVAYVGQILSVVDNTAETVDVYKITNTEGDLELVGTVPVGDNNTVDVGADGKIKLHGIDGKGTGTYQPALVNGVLTWTVPSSTTVEGLSTDIDGVKTRLTTAEGDIDAVEAKLANLGADTVKAAIDAAVEAGAYDDSTLAGKVTAIENDYLKAEDKTALEDKVTTEKERAEAAELALANRLTPVEAFFVTAEGETLDTALDTLVEIQKYIDEHGEVAAEMLTGIADNASNITTLSERVDELRAIDHTVYAKSADVTTALAGKVDAEEGKRLMTADEGTKLGGIEAGAEVNVIDAVDATEFAISETDRKLSILAVAQSKVTGLSEALEDKVDKVEGSRLITGDEATKLEKLVLGEDGTVSISGEINASNVKELGSWITTNRDSVPGLLSTVDGTKLAAVENGAQVNILEAVSINGVNLIPDGKTINIPLATVNSDGALSAIDKAFIDSIKDTYATKTELATLAEKVDAAEEALTWGQL